MTTAAAHDWRAIEALFTGGVFAAQNCRSAADSGDAGRHLETLV